MQIRDRLAAHPKPEPFTVEADQMVSDAVSKMSEFNYGSAIVVDEQKKVIGIVTERDIVKRLVNAGLDAKDTPVSAIMTSSPRLARETDEIEEWMRTMSQNRFRRIPIVDEEDRVRAVLTQTDMVAYSWPLLVEQAKQNAERDARKNYVILLIGGAILIYSIAIVYLTTGL